ncbi:anti-sigma-F factor Fin [Brevibacillus daliensis]|uniref:anti-sigma-F factor Fin n=1 Tax=Brevibacillus daliensis TaxID=2892995 RepID=UPI001E388269|nr:anti-sigma-F factor Fin [Brevibacillus daliensis]
MRYRYLCRYCGHNLGEINQEHITETQLGFHFLTPQERQTIISKDDGGNTVVHVLCDYCKEALDLHPELSLIGNPLQ